MWEHNGFMCQATNTSFLQYTIIVSTQNVLQSVAFPKGTVVLAQTHPSGYLTAGVIFLLNKWYSKSLVMYSIKTKQNFQNIELFY